MSYGSNTYITKVIQRNLIRIVHYHSKLFFSQPMYQIILDSMCLCFTVLKVVYEMLVYIRRSLYKSIFLFTVQP